MNWVDNKVVCHIDLVEWLIAPDDWAVEVFPQQQPELCHGSDVLIVLNKIELALTAEQMLSWLKMAK